MDNSRRNCLCGLGGLAVGGAVAALVGTGSSIAQAAAPAKRFEQVNGEFGWKPHKLDPKECAKVAYEGYWYKGYACGYGAFYSIIGVLGEKYGAPYNQFPFSMLEANKGGISDWGTICGALYGAVKGDLPQNASGSVLCHISVSKWCATNKIEATSKARSERCGRLTADVAYKAVEIFNAKIEQGKNYKGTFAVQPAVSGCGECHQTKGNDANWAKGVMDCTPCHNGAEPLQNKFENHP